MQTTSEVRQGNTSDVEYDSWILRINKFYAENLSKYNLFSTSAENLWESYLSAMPDSIKQYHTCSTCKHFIERYADLVYINDDGSISSAIWNLADTPEEYVPSITAMLTKIERSRIIKPFYSSHVTFGTFETGIWQHIAIKNKTIFVSNNCAPHEFAAEKKENFSTVSLALSEWSEKIIASALTILKADALYRSEAVLGQAEWLYKLQIERAKVKGLQKENILWKAIASAPSGFCHPRASMIGTLLDDLKEGKNFDQVAKSFAAKMHPLQYRRPTAAPKAQLILEAEKLVESLGLARSFDRRFARLDEIQAIWRPKIAEEKKESAGLFGHLKAKGETETPELEVPAQLISFEKFCSKILPEVKELEIYVPQRGNFTATLTAEHEDSPPIFQWDSLGQRNTFSQYVWYGVSSANSWSITAGWTKVDAIMLAPHMWYDKNLAHMDEYATFVIAKMKETTFRGNALFPESIRSELHGIRSVIEAYSKSAELKGRENQSANGLRVQKNSSVTVRFNQAGVKVVYKIDRWD